MRKICRFSFNNNLTFLFSKHKTFKLLFLFQHANCISGALVARNWYEKFVKKLKFYFIVKILLHKARKLLRKRVIVLAGRDSIFV